ncbi:MAG: LysR substrate-binding domain-containing protein [Myxococcota bacterium]
MLEVRRLRLLFELDRRGTMAAVARAVGASPSAVSQQLALFEAETGVALLEAVGRGVRLTSAGRGLMPHAAAIFERLERAEAELAASSEEVSGTIRAACFPSVLTTLMPAALARLGELHPGLRVEVVERQPEAALDGLHAWDFDLVLGDEFPGFPQAKDAAVHEEDLAVDELLLVLPRQGPWASLEPQLTASARAPWAMDPPYSATTHWAKAQCRRAGFEPDVLFETPDSGLQLQLVEAGQAVALIPGMLRRLGRKRVRWVRLPGRPSRRVFTAVRRGTALHPGLVALRASLRYAADT